MRRFLVSRLVHSLPAAWVILSVIFLLSRALVSNPADFEGSRGGNLAAHTATPERTQTAERLLRQRLGLTLPLFYVTPAAPANTLHWRWQWNGLRNQYHIWLRNLLRGDLGRSFRDDQPVTTLLLRALASTLPLTTLAFVVTIVAARTLTLLLARYRGMRPAVLGGLHILHGLPLFVVALLLLLLLANPDVLAIFPAYGMGRPESAASWGSQLLSFLYYTTLPLLSLVLVSLPSLVVQLDNSLQQELRADYVVTARAKGLANRLVIRHHALRNALLPAIIYITDLLPALVAGAVVVELIFAVPGMGRLLAEAAAAQDFPVLLGGVLLIAGARLLAQVLADWLSYQADPRIRLEA